MANSVGCFFLRAMNLWMKQKCKFASRFHRTIVSCMCCPTDLLVKVIIGLIFRGINFAIFEKERPTVLNGKILPNILLNY